jgi:hypothetical protein
MTLGLWRKTRLKNFESDLCRSDTCFVLGQPVEIVELGREHAKLRAATIGMQFIWATMVAAFSKETPCSRLVPAVLTEPIRV